MGKLAGGGGKSQWGTRRERRDRRGVPGFPPYERICSTSEGGGPVLRESKEDLAPQEKTETTGGGSSAQSGTATEKGRAKGVNDTATAEYGLSESRGRKSRGTDAPGERRGLELGLRDDTKRKRLNRRTTSAYEN